MQTLKAELVEFRSARDLKPLLASQGPCLSLYVSLEPWNALRLNWEDALRQVEDRLDREMHETVADWNAILGDIKPEGKAMAVFRSPNIFQFTWLDEPVQNAAFVGQHFNIRPVLADLTKAKSFYLLALSQKNVRLLQCTSRHSEEVPFPAGFIIGYEEYMNTAKPDHIVTGMVSDRDKNEYLSHFFKQIDRGINEILRGKSEPMVLAGVDYELALYRAVNKYPHLRDEAVQGAPNSLKSGEMHARAIEALKRCYLRRVDEAIAEYNHKVGGGASNHLKDVVMAAHDGRVLTLLISDSLSTTGSYNGATHSVKARETGGDGDEDLVNMAAVETILHSGNVFVAPNTKMPNGAPVAAVFRF